jgi:hypothetical protein
LSTSISTIGFSLHPAAKKEKLKLPEDAKPMEKLLQPYLDQNVNQLFELFFRGFTDPLWLPYLNNDNLTLPFEFSFETGCHDARSIEIFNIFIHPCALPAKFCGGRLNDNSYEYYQPNIMARQLGCGQMPPRLFLHEFLKPREKIKDSIQARRVFEYQCSPTLYTWLFHTNNNSSPSFHLLVARIP